MVLSDTDKHLLELMDEIIDAYPKIFNTEEGVYELTNGRCVPRVTQIIHSCIHNEGLMRWANYIGYKRQSYTKTLEAAANVGIYCHQYINEYIEQSKIPNIYASMDAPLESFNAYLSFAKWFNDIKNLATVKPLRNEYSLLCKYFGGTLDGLYDINGKMYLVDYKTSNHVTFNYCLQVAAYDFMLEYLEDIHTDGYIILQLSKVNPSFNEYSLHKYDPTHKEFMTYCRTAFLTMALWYYYMSVINIQYKTLKWEGKKEDG